MSYFYGEEMTYCECVMPLEIRWEVMDHLGKAENIHFEASAIDYENPHAKGLKRCEELLFKLKEIRKIMEKIENGPKLTEPKNYKEILCVIDEEIKKNKVSGHGYFVDIEAEIEYYHEFLSAHSREAESLSQNTIEKIDELVILYTASKRRDYETLLAIQKDFSQNVRYEWFICSLDNISALERTIFRVTRGHSMIEVFGIDEGLSEILGKYDYVVANKTVAMAIYPEGNSGLLIRKINKLIDNYASFKTEINLKDWQSRIDRTIGEISDLKKLEEIAEKTIQDFLIKINEPRNDSHFSNFFFLEAVVKKQREIAKQLSTMTISHNFAHFMAFIPSKNLPLSIDTDGNYPPLTILPRNKEAQKLPTKFDTPPILEMPQTIVNTYGVPSYGQFNPAPLYIVSFGFLIGVMFGDVGHSLMAVPFLIMYRVNAWFWIIVFFMFYSGLIYNEFYGLNFGLFNSCYQESTEIYDYTTGVATATGLFSFTQRDHCVYPLGVDSRWKNTENIMQFSNSLKMKMAVIIGVVHMMLGLFIRLSNNIRKRKFVQMFGITIPQIAFMACTFLYMDFLIVDKWARNYQGQATKNAPSIIGIMISSYGGFGKIKHLLYEHEKKAEEQCRIIAIVMVPIMLLAVPIVTMISRKLKKKSELYRVEERSVDGYEMGEMIGHDHHQKHSEERIGEEPQSSNIVLPPPTSKRIIKEDHEEEEEPIGEIMVHSIIETIEFVLGSISNTASYLRLWALSLAHMQLSEVIFNLVMRSSLKGGYGSIFAKLIEFYFFAGITFGVLLAMGSLECFLHSLRLHWVEFQNKFFEGKGFLFTPFSFKEIYEDKAFKL